MSTTIGRWIARSRRALVIIAGCGAVTMGASGCPAPIRAYGLPQIDFRQVEMANPPPRPKRQARSAPVLVLPRWVNATPNPVGGLYDYTSYTVSPLYRTYFFADAAVPLWEGCVRQLRAAGYRAFKDYSGTGEVGSIKKPARDERALMLRGRLLGLVHDQLKEGGEQPPSQAAFVEVEFVLADLGGEVLWRAVKTVALKLANHPQLDMLHAVGGTFARLLIDDPALRQKLSKATAVSAATTAKAEVR